MAVIKQTKQLTGTTGLVDIVTAPAAGKVRRVDLNACNIDAGGAYASADVYINDGANSGYRKKGYPIPPPPDPDCAVMLERGLMLYEGQSLQIRAGAASSVAFSAEIIEDDA